jgi:hypothetical protein
VDQVRWQQIERLYHAALACPRNGAERSAGLSQDGRLLYLLHEHDGFRCLYARRLDPVNGHPMGEPFLVHHFHDASRRWGSTGFGNATVTDVPGGAARGQQQHLDDHYRIEMSSSTQEI